MTTPPHPDFADLVRSMRSAQRKWFRDHDHTALQESKRLEREVDRALTAMDGQPTLFVRAER